MTILLANDDGYQAEGIQVLLRVLEEAGHEVWMAAPDGERSAKSHSMTLGEDIVARKIGENRWILNGQPGDCVLYGLKGGLFPRTPDMVVTGINRGYNISTDVCYSGTIGAAEEATLCGVPAIALSCQGRPYPYEATARFALAHLESFRSLCGASSYVSVNVPGDTDGKSWEPAVLSPLGYNDAVVKTSGSGMRTFDHQDARFGSSVLLRFKGEEIRGRKDLEGSDLDVVAHGRIAVSVFEVLPSVDPRGQANLEKLRKSDANT